MALVECIPNFSEARRPEIIDQIAAAVTSVPDVRLLDRSSDLDHNRTVLTFAGPPLAVEEAAFHAIQKAAELIDLNQHTGGHPRIGAADVVPFVPISGITMEDCVAIAKRLGARVGKELGLPVYLYESAATRPDRADLENIRRGQYEGLKAEIETDPERKPDYGPARLGPAGATVIGARNPLIAFNIYLNTSDIGIAKKIARAIRHSSGGMRYCKALGLPVEGRAQVSMNLTNFRETPVARIVELVRREAARYGTGIYHTELIGLIPQDALTEAAVWYLQLDGFSPDQILEKRLYAAEPDGAESEDANTYGFIDELAAATATPGGGSAAAYAAAMGAGLVAMVAGLTMGKKKYADIEAEMKEVLAQAEALRAELTHYVDDDAAAFEAVMGALRLPKDSPEQEKARTAAVQMATFNAAHIPLRVAQHAVKVMGLAARCAEVANANAISDSACAGAMARAALTAADYNVRINVANVSDKSAGKPLLAELHKLEAQAARIEKSIHKTLEDRGGLAA